MTLFFTEGPQKAGPKPPSVPIGSGSLPLCRRGPLIGRRKEWMEKKEKGNRNMQEETEKALVFARVFTGAFHMIEGEEAGESNTGINRGPRVGMRGPVWSSLVAVVGALH